MCPLILLRLYRYTHLLHVHTRCRTLLPTLITDPLRRRQTRSTSEFEPTYIRHFRRAVVSHRRRFVDGRQDARLVACRNVVHVSTAIAELWMCGDAVNGWISKLHVKTIFNTFLGCGSNTPNRESGSYILKVLVHSLFHARSK